jgi:hypothetical protein
LDPLRDLTDVILAARRGLRRDVALLVEKLDDGELLLPLSKSVPGATHGADHELTADVTIQPHLLVDEEGQAFCTAFTHPDIIHPVVEKVGWTTDGNALEFAAVPARVALDLSLQVIDDENVVGLVLNPMHESELMLRRSEIGSILQGRALPLVGYVQQIPLQDFEETLVAEGAEPPPAALVEAVERCVVESDDLVGFELLSTFNADRDLEPHLTLTVRPAKTDIDFEAVTRRLVERIGDLVPPPGYIDIVFDRSP